MSAAEYFNFLRCATRFPSDLDSLLDVKSIDFKPFWELENQSAYITSAGEYVKTEWVDIVTGIRIVMSKGLLSFENKASVSDNEFSLQFHVMAYPNPIPSPIYFFGGYLEDSLSSTEVDGLGGFAVASAEMSRKSCAYIMEIVDGEGLENHFQQFYNSDPDSDYWAEFYSRGDK